MEPAAKKSRFEAPNYQDDIEPEILTKQSEHQHNCKSEMQGTKLIYRPDLDQVDFVYTHKYEMGANSDHKSELTTSRDERQCNESELLKESGSDHELLKEEIGTDHELLIEESGSDHELLIDKSGSKSLIDESRSDSQIEESGLLIEEFTIKREPMGNIFHSDQTAQWEISDSKPNHMSVFETANVNGEQETELGKLDHKLAQGSTSGTKEVVIQHQSEPPKTILEPEFTCEAEHEQSGTSHECNVEPEASEVNRDHESDLEILENELDVESDSQQGNLNQDLGSESEENVSTNLDVVSVMDYFPTACNTYTNNTCIFGSNLALLISYHVLKE